jgi:hypothetical protein
MFEIELAVLKDFQAACEAGRYVTTGRVPGNFDDPKPIPADLYRSASLTIERGELRLLSGTPRRGVRRVDIKMLSAGLSAPLAESAAEAPPKTAPEPAPAAPDRTGFPGRPSKSKHLIDDEFERRVAAGEALPVLVEEAQALLQWFKAKYLTAERPTVKTIQNNIRSRHRASRPCEAATGKRPK